MSVVKKLFFVSALILAVSLLFLGIYNLSFKKPSEISVPKKETPVTPPINQPEAETTKIKTVSDEAVLSPTLSPDGLSIKYYSKTSGRAYETDIDGENKKNISDKDLLGLNSILWSPDKTRVIAKFVDAGGKSQFSSYDYSVQKGFLLDKNITEAVWDGMGSKIFYAYRDSGSGKSTLNISNPDGSNWKKIADLSWQNAAIAPIPQSGLISFWNKADSLAQADLESIPIIGGEKKVLFKEKFGADYLWNSSGTNALISHSDNKGGSKTQLALINYNGGEYANLGIPSFTSKCAWSKDGKTLYYALPGNIPDNSVLPNDYNEGKFKTSDTFWKMDMASKKSERIVEIEDLQKINTSFDASNLFLSQDERFLFFVNKADGKLYRINL
jgi:hypothetical protein